MGCDIEVAHQALHKTVVNMFSVKIVYFTISHCFANNHHEIVPNSVRVIWDLCLACSIIRKCMNIGTMTGWKCNFSNCLPCVTRS